IINSGTAASIYGHVRGVLAGKSTTVINAGTIRSQLVHTPSTGYGAYGVELTSGSVSNASTGLIAGEFIALNVNRGAATVTNAGTIEETQTPTTPGAVSYAGALFSGNYNDTLTNAGTIIAAEGAAAVRFTGTGTNRVIVVPGAVFTGDVIGGGGNDTLEL